MTVRVALPDEGPPEAEAVALKLDHCHTRLASPPEAAVVCGRFARGCSDLGGEAEIAGGRVRFRLAAGA